MPSFSAWKSTVCIGARLIALPTLCPASNAWTKEAPFWSQGGANALMKPNHHIANGAFAKVPLPPRSSAGVVNLIATMSPLASGIWVRCYACAPHTATT